MREFLHEMCELELDVDGEPAGETASDSAAWGPTRDAWRFIDDQERAARNLRATPPPWSAPVSPFEDPRDWTNRVQLVDFDDRRGYSLPSTPWELTQDGINVRLLEVDKRAERTVAIVVDRATAAHLDQHQDVSHPHCTACEERWARSPYDGNDQRYAASTARDFEAAATERARGWILRPKESDLPTPEESDRIRERPPLVIDRDRLREVEPMRWVIEGVVPAASVGILFGPSGSLKSFLALDVCCAIATGKERWHGRDVGTWETQPGGDQIEVYTPTRVLYVIGEGRAGINTRLNAWEAHHGQAVPSDYLHIGQWMPNLTTGDGFEELLAAVQEHRYDLIVVDTMRKAAGEGDENSASERGALIDRLYALSETSGGTVLAVHHSGHTEGRMRGSSAQLADADFVLQMEREETALTVSTQKMKDGSDSTSVDLTYRAVGASLVLVGVGQTPVSVWTSTNLQDALWAFVKGQVDSGQGEPTQADLVTLGKDEHGVKRTVVQRALSDLIKRDLITVNKVQNTSHYAPGPVPWPSQMGPE